jgi:hypothetical protein
MENIQISKEDTQYLTNLLNRSDELINFIGKIEIEKNYLLQQHDGISKQISEYNTQMFEKYGLDTNFKYEIDIENGEIIRKN